MRLLNVNDLNLRTFQPANLPKYAVTSHRWGDDEASMQDVSFGLDLRKRGHRKVKGFVDYVRDEINGIEWIWIDTCCINQDSSQEVSEAINSMFKWYRNSEICLAYLADVAKANLAEDFEKSIWFTRGWTLQELLAPSVVVFLSQDWNVIGRTGGEGTSYDYFGVQLHVGPSLVDSIHAITRIPKRVIIDYSESWDTSLQDRMQWATGRQTTREEDLVYCLLGICGVTMPIVYGEGFKKARKRLVQELKAEGHDLHEGHAPSSHRRVSVPYSVEPTYTDRIAMSKELEGKLQQAPVDQALGRTFGVVGYAGCGKTQLVLRYIQNHQEEYDPILWIDMSSRSAVRTSFERCCNDLALPVGTVTDQEEIKDIKDEPAIKTLLLWLRCRPRHEEWLVVLDRADNLRLDVGAIVPRGQAGTVITISCDTVAARHLVGNSAIMKVGAMSTSEGVELLQKCLGRENEQDEVIHHLAERFVASVGNLPLAIKLVGTKMRVELHNEGTGTRECLTHHTRDHYDIPIQQNQDHDKDSEQDQDQGKELILATSLQLFRLLALFSLRGMQEEIFRLAALKIESTAQVLCIQVPSWLRGLLRLGGDGLWTTPPIGMHLLHCFAMDLSSE